MKTKPTKTNTKKTSQNRRRASRRSLSGGTAPRIEIPLSRLMTNIVVRLILEKSVTDHAPKYIVFSSQDTTIDRLRGEL